MEENNDYPPPPPPLFRTHEATRNVSRQGANYEVSKDENNSDMITYNGNNHLLQFDDVTREKFIIIDNARVVFTGGRSKRKKKRRRTRKYKK